MLMVFVTIIVMLIGFFTAIVYYASMYRVVFPNRALVIQSTGGTKVRERILTSGGTAVFSGSMQVTELDLEAIPIDQNLSNLTTKDGMRIDLSTYTLVQIDKLSDALRTAASVLRDKDRDEIANIARSGLEAVLRVICAKLTLEQLKRDQAIFSMEVLNIAVPYLENVGMNIIAIAIRKIDFVGHESGKACPECGKMVRARVRKGEPRGDA
jgi:flotillin